jgi:peroxin-5
MMQGGACNPDGSQQMSHSSNPVRNLLHNVFFHQSKIGQMKGGFYPEEQMMHPEHFDKDWEMLARKFEKSEMSEAEMHKMMQQEWFAAKAREEEMRRMAEFEQKKAWQEGQMMAAKHEQEQVMLEKMMGEQWKDAKLQAEVNDWKGEFMDKELEDAFEKAQKLVEKKDEDTVIKESSNYMVDVMESDPDPRFQSSKLLEMLKKLQSGAYQIKDNELIKNHEGMDQAWEGAKDQIRMDKAWGQADMNTAWEEHKIEAKEDGAEETEKVFDKMWKKMQAGEYETPEQAELDAEYQKIVEQMEKMNGGNLEDMFSDMWNVEQDIQEYHAYGEVPEQYKFGDQNPFASEAKPLELASNLLNQGNIRNAILALEAHLQKHPNDSNSWRVLGKLHMDNDEDRPAVRCLLNSVNIDANNLDNLLALGVSCTNILDEVQAMNHLKHWMMNNPKYKHIVTDPEIIPENLVGKSINMEDIKAMNGRLIEHFEKARSVNPQDPELATSLAVLYFVARDYKASVSLFNEALKYDTNNYSLWNKLGATLAHLGRSDEAIEAYHRALEFKPNYVRAWVNLGIAHAYKGDFEEAARFYLSALSMNQGAEHVWSYLQTTLMSLQRYDLLKLIANRDLEGFKKEFDIVLPDDLPAPEIAYRELNEQFLVKQKSENWFQEFNQS